MCSVTNGIANDSSRTIGTAPSHFGPISVTTSGPATTASPA